ncbi:hypothetical protein HYY71_01135 [Candidatus Woesearchaeota archaeon]|nr:hypothetical protein [Candidatus Woesearchaeota archaeon]
MKKSWIKEIARDLLALGSIPFYFLVVVRAVIGKYNAFVYQMLIAALVVFILYFLMKDSSLHVGRAFVILVFTSLFYKDMLFAAFASLAWVLLLISAYYIKRSVGFVLRGIMIGAIGSLAGYYTTLYLV